MNRPHPDESPGESAWALIGVSLCEASRRLHVFSLAALGITFIMGIPGSGGGLVLGLLLMAAFLTAACQAYFAWRLAFDLPVFAVWSRLPDEMSPNAQRTFDAALGALLKKSLPARDMSARVRGAKRLHLLQISALLGQVLVLLVFLGRLLYVYAHA
jgi:hypothetical protein